MVVVREGTEGPYVGNGGRLREGTPHEVATEASLNTAHGVERVVRDAFRRAQARERRHVTLVHKTNVLVHAGGLWKRVFDEVAAEYPDVATDYQHVDAAAMYFVTQPERFDVVVTDNLFGDILTDIGAAIGGGIGLAASGNIDATAPTRRCSSRCTAAPPTSPARDGRPDGDRAVGGPAAGAPRPRRAGAEGGGGRGRGPAHARRRADGHGARSATGWRSSPPARTGGPASARECRRRRRSRTAARPARGRPGRPRRQRVVGRRGPAGTPRRAVHADRERPAGRARLGARAGRRDLDLERTPRRRARRRPGDRKTTDGGPVTSGPATARSSASPVRMSSGSPSTPVAARRARTERAGSGTRSTSCSHGGLQAEQRGQGGQQGGLGVAAVTQPGVQVGERGGPGRSSRAGTSRERDAEVAQQPHGARPGQPRGVVPAGAVRVDAVRHEDAGVLPHEQRLGADAGQGGEAAAGHQGHPATVPPAPGAGSRPVPNGYRRAIGRTGRGGAMTTAAAPSSGCPAPRRAATPSARRSWPTPASAASTPTTWSPSGGTPRRAGTTRG